MSQWFWGFIYDYEVSFMKYNTYTLINKILIIEQNNFIENIFTPGFGLMMFQF